MQWHVRLHTAQVGGGMHFMSVSLSFPPAPGKNLGSSVVRHTFLGLHAGDRSAAPVHPRCTAGPMEVHMHDRLSGGFTDIDPDIVTGGIIPCIPVLYCGNGQVKPVLPGSYKKKRIRSERG